MTNSCTGVNFEKFGVYFETPVGVVGIPCKEAILRNSSAGRLLVWICNLEGPKGMQKRMFRHDSGRKVSIHTAD